MKTALKPWPTNQLTIVLIAQLRMASQRVRIIHGISLLPHFLLWTGLPFDTLVGTKDSDLTKKHRKLLAHTSLIAHWDRRFHDANLVKIWSGLELWPQALQSYKVRRSDCGSAVCWAKLHWAGPPCSPNKSTSTPLRHDSPEDPPVHLLHKGTVPMKLCSTPSCVHKLGCGSKEAMTQFTKKDKYCTDHVMCIDASYT